MIYVTVVRLGHRNGAPRYKRTAAIIKDTERPDKSFKGSLLTHSNGEVTLDFPPESGITKERTEELRLMIRSMDDEGVELTQDGQVLLMLCSFGRIVPNIFFNFGHLTLVPKPLRKKTKPKTKNIGTE